MKICSQCGIVKDINYFYKRKDTKDGYRANCKNCHNISTKPGTIKYQSKETSIINKLIYNKKYWSDNANELTIKNKEKYYKNKEKYLKQKKDYYVINKDIISKRNVRYVRLKLLNDPIFKFKHLVRSSIRQSIKENRFCKLETTEKIIGISLVDFIIYLESKFEPWMNWDNHGLYNGEFNYGWDMDHIIPMSSAKTEEDVIKLNHFSNFQPLCSKINRYVKRDKLNWNF